MAYVQPEQYRGLQPTPAQSSTYFKYNSYQNPYQSFINQNQKQAQGMLNTQSPFAGMTNMNDFQSKFGWKTLNPNDPNIPAWMTNLQGGVRNAVDQNAQRTANAGIAAGRAGMGVAGGPSMAASMAMQGNRDVAQMYPQLYSQAVDWTRQGNADWNSGANALVGALSDVYKTQVGAGGNLMQMVLQALQSGDAAQMQWAMKEMEAFNQDTATTNALRANERNYGWQEADRRAQQQQTGIDQQRAFEQDQMRRRVTTGYNYNTGWQSNPDVPGSLAYLQSTGAMPMGRVAGGSLGSIPMSRENDPLGYMKNIQSWYAGAR